MITASPRLAQIQVSRRFPVAYEPYSCSNVLHLPYSGYDGGDCCECDCTSNSISICGFYNAFDCVDPTSRCVNGYVEVGTKTTVGVSANSHDTRPGETSGDNCCMKDGCAPALTRDGISTDIESRWSCAQEIVPDGGLCEIEFMFESPQDVMDIQVAFGKGDERLRTLQVGSYEYGADKFRVYRHGTRKEFEAVL